MTQETINPVDNVELKRKAQDELVHDASKEAKPSLESAGSEATLSSEQIVTEPTEDAVAEPVDTEDVSETKEETAESEVEVQEAEEEAEEEAEDEKVEPTKKVKNSKKEDESDFEDEDFDEDEAALDKKNIITSGRRTRGKVIDFKALVASDEEDDEDDEE